LIASASQIVTQKNPKKKYKETKIRPGNAHLALSQTKTKTKIKTKTKTKMDEGVKDETRGKNLKKWA
jgi:hypothetical protein